MSKSQKVMGWIFSLIGAVACWKMAYTLFQTWQTPLAVENGRWVSLGTGIMLMEFVLCHSGVMLPALASSENFKPLSKKPFLFVSVMYIFFGVTYAVLFKSTLLFWTFTGIMVPRWIGLVLDPVTVREKQIQRSRESILLYFGCVILSVFIPFPRGGLTTAILNQVYPHRGGGTWGRDPQQVLVAGAVYFSLMGILEITYPFRKKSFLRSPVIGTIVLLVVVYTNIGMFFG